jgi:hypothetical protein
MKTLSPELAEEIAGLIDNEGFDYWLRDGGWAIDQLQDYPFLLALAKQARDTMDMFEAALADAGLEQL